MEHMVCYPVSFPSFEVLDHRNRGLWHAYQGPFSGVLDGSGSSCSKSVAATRQQKEVISPTWHAKLQRRFFILEMSGKICCVRGCPPHVSCFMPEWLISNVNPTVIAVITINNHKPTCTYFGPKWIGCFGRFGFQDGSWLPGTARVKIWGKEYNTLAISARKARTWLEESTERIGQSTKIIQDVDSNIEVKPKTHHPINQQVEGQIIPDRENSEVFHKNISPL